LLIERAILDENVAAMQRIADSQGVALRPHAKTHKLPELAQLQVDRGARGVTVATLTEAECMVAAGIDNLFLAYPPTGKWRLERLAPILGRASVTVGLDTLDAVRSLSRLGAELRRTIAYRWEVDSGPGRLGTAPGWPTLDRLLPALDEPWTSSPDSSPTPVTHTRQRRSKRSRPSAGRRANAS
jgi:D-serine deaminase-like pyridoxal phosphate-dependent protein